MIPNREDGKAWNTAKYEWKSASVNKANSTPTDSLTGVTGFTTLFDTVKRAHHVVIEAAGTIYVKLKADGITGDTITITATTPFEDHYGIVEDILIATGGVGVTVTVKLR